jgi:hypothetical protein
MPVHPTVLLPSHVPLCTAQPPPNLPPLGGGVQYCCKRSMYEKPPQVSVPLTPRPLPLGEGASGQVVLFELAVQCGQADIQNAGGNLPIASMPLQRLHNSFSFNLGEGSIGG